jgi:hypothetical protein
MTSDLQSLATILPSVVALASLLAAIYIFRKSEPTRAIAKIQLNKERAKTRLIRIADMLRTWEGEMQIAELKNEKFEPLKSTANPYGFRGIAIGVLAETFAEAYSAYPNFVTTRFFDLILKDVKDEKGAIVSSGTFFDSRENILLTMREIDRIITTL